MPIMEQNSSILSEQELHLLAAHPHQYAQDALRVYSYQYSAKLENNPLFVAQTIEQLTFMLNASPRRVALILPGSIESEPIAELEQLIRLLTRRNDILVFWLGQLPSMEIDLTFFVHCPDEQQLFRNIEIWQSRIHYLYCGWLAQYPIAFITENESKKKRHQAVFDILGVSNISYFDAISSLTEIDTPKLLIIDLEVTGLHLVNILKYLTNKEWFPIIIIYGRLAKNVCHASYTLIENSGFPVLASLSDIPKKNNWEKLFSSLFSKVYLKHWINEDIEEVSAYKLYNLYSKEVVSYFCSYGMSKKQITALPQPTAIRHIINAKSIKDWYPDGLKRDIRRRLALELNCAPSQLDICIERPEKVLSTSIFFSTLVMARLAKTKVYWFINNENNLLSDYLKSFPISDVIFSESLSLQLLADPPEALLTFIAQAQQQQVSIIASLPPSTSSKEALALYGIEYVLSN